METNYNEVDRLSICPISITQEKKQLKIIFTKLNRHEQLVIASQFFNQYQGLDNYIMEKLIIDTEHKHVRSFVEEFCDEIIRNPQEFRNLDFDKKIELIVNLGITSKIDDSTRIYLFWKQEHEYICDFINTNQSYIQKYSG